MEKILDIIDSIAYAKELKVEDVESALKEALIETATQTVKQQFEDNYIFDAEIDRENKKLRLFQKVEVIADDDPRLDIVQDIELYTPITDALVNNPSVEIGDIINYEFDFEELGRSGASLLYQKLEYKLQNSVENNLVNKYKDKIGTIASGVVIRVDNQENTLIEVGEIKGILYMKNRIKGEKFKLGDMVKTVIKGVKIDPTYGMVIELSRTSPNFLKALLKKEVPEIEDGEIIIEEVSRIPGQKAKISLTSTNAKIDAVGSIVGVRGMRINSVSKELNNEIIDCIEHSPIKEKFIIRALNPAIINKVEVFNDGKDDAKALVYISKNQKSKAIGKGGFNIRLTAMLTRTKIELVDDETITVSDNNNGNSNNNNSKTESLDNLKALFK